MTNGEMIQKVFNCEVCEPIIEDDIIHVIFADKKDGAIGFDWSWWNMEYKEPTTKNDLALIHTEGLDEEIRCTMCTNYMKSDRGCDGSCVVNKDMYKAVMDALEKRIQPTTKNDLGVDCIVDVLGSYTDLDIPYKREIAENIITKLPSVTPQEATQMIDKSNFSREQYVIDTNTAWQCGYEAGKKEQEPILDKIYADIQKLRGCSCSCSDGIIDDVEDILDKYKAESEDT